MAVDLRLRRGALQLLALVVKNARVAWRRPALPLLFVLAPVLALVVCEVLARAMAPSVHAALLAGSALAPAAPMALAPRLPLCFDVTSNTALRDCVPLVAAPVRKGRDGVHHEARRGRPTENSAGRADTFLPSRTCLNLTGSVCRKLGRWHPR